MARFDAWPNPDGIGWLLDVQADLLRDLNTRVVVPLMPLAAAVPVGSAAVHPSGQPDIAEGIGGCRDQCAGPVAGGHLTRSRKRSARPYSGTNRGRSFSASAMNLCSLASASASLSPGLIGVTKRTSAPSLRPRVKLSQTTLNLAA